MNKRPPSLEERHKLTFAQAEGAEPLPLQLRPSEISRRLRISIWSAVRNSMLEHSHDSDFEGHFLVGPWAEATKILAFEHFLDPDDDYDNDFDHWSMRLKHTFLNKSYIEFYGTLQALCRLIGEQLTEFPDQIAEVLKAEQSGYRLLDRRTLFPVASPEEIHTIERAAKDLRRTGRDSASKHLEAAAEEMSQGNFAGAVREAIHSVESVAVWIEPEAKTLHDAIVRLEKKKRIHPSLKKGFSAIYGYTSDEKGVRHALVEGRETNVSESEAQFMIGACAAFVSYLVNLALDKDNAAADDTPDQAK
jgi:AbiJ N-terminal domain 4